MCVKVSRALIPLPLPSRPPTARPRGRVLRVTLERLNEAGGHRGAGDRDGIHVFRQIVHLRTVSHGHLLVDYPEWGCVQRRDAVDIISTSELNILAQFSQSVNSFSAVLDFVVS